MPEKFKLSKIGQQVLDTYRTDRVMFWCMKIELLEAILEQQRELCAPALIMRNCRDVIQKARAKLLEAMYKE